MGVNSHIKKEEERMIDKEIIDSIKRIFFDANNDFDGLINVFIYGYNFDNKKTKEQN